MCTSWHSLWHLLRFILNLEWLVKEGGVCELPFCYKANQYDTLLINQHTRPARVRVRSVPCHAVLFVLASLRLPGLFAVNMIRYDYHSRPTFSPHHRLHLDVISLSGRPLNVAGMLFTALKRPCVFMRGAWVFWSTSPHQERNVSWDEGDHPVFLDVMRTASTPSGNDWFNAGKTHPTQVHNNLRVTACLKFDRILF